MVRNILNKLKSIVSSSSSSSPPISKSVTAKTNLIAVQRQKDIQKLAAHMGITEENESSMVEMVSNHVLKQTIHLLKDLHKNIKKDDNYHKHSLFELCLSTSLVGPNSGDGLFLKYGGKKGRIDPGNIVAMYPGTSLYHEDLSFFGGIDKMFNEDEMNWFIHRSDGVLIDGLGKTHELKSQGGTFSGSDGGDTEGSALSDIMNKMERLQEYGYRCAEVKENPFAIAHKANHPPVGIPANVVAVPIDYNFSLLPKDLLPYIPIRHGLFPHILCENGITFVASRVIEEGDEIYLDYATSIESRPDWYTEAKRDED
jgi:hypothetical protein